MSFRISKNTFAMSNPPTIKAFSSTVSSKEGEGPIGSCFDVIENDTHFGQESWEQAESELQKQTVKRAIEKAGITPEDVNFIFAGDLINQCIGVLMEYVTLIYPFSACMVHAQPWQRGYSSLPFWPITESEKTSLQRLPHTFQPQKDSFDFPLLWCTTYPHCPVDLYRLRCRCGVPIGTSSFLT